MKKFKVLLGKFDDNDRIEENELIDDWVKSFKFI